MFPPHFPWTLGVELTGYLAKEVGFGDRFGSIRRLRSKFATSCTASSLYLRRPSFEDRVPSENQEIPKQLLST